MFCLELFKDYLAFFIYFLISIKSFIIESFRTVEHVKTHFRTCQNTIQNMSKHVKTRFETCFTRFQKKKQTKKVNFGQIENKFSTKNKNFQKNLIFFFKIKKKNCQKKCLPTYLDLGTNGQRTKRPRDR